MPRSNKNQKTNSRKGKSVMKNDHPMFNDNSDSDYSNASEALEAKESLQVQVRLRLKELLLFKGAQVEIVHFGDDVSNPWVSGLVSLVDTTPSKETLHLSPAVIDGQTLKIYKIGVSDIESVTALLAPKYTWADLTALSSDDNSLGNLAQSHLSGYSWRPASCTPPAPKQLNVSRPASRNSLAGPSCPRSHNQGSRPASRARSCSPQGPVTRAQSASRIRYLSGNSSTAKESPSVPATSWRSPPPKKKSAGSASAQHRISANTAH
jgi:hypothetical protein